MTSPTPSARRKSPARLVIQRFAHIIPASAVDGILSTAFFLCLARWDPLLYGEVMYGFAAGSVVVKVVQFGLYYPLVGELSAGSDGEARRTLAVVNGIRMVLLVASMAAIFLLAQLKGLSTRMAGILYLLCFGFALEALAESFFAYLRVKGRQKTEARIKMSATALGYGSSFMATLVAWPGMFVGCFRAVLGFVCVVSAARNSGMYKASWPFIGSNWPAAKRLLLAATTFGLIDIVGMVFGRTNIFFLEGAAGPEGVAVYGAAWSVVEAIASLASQQLLALVVFPLLSVLWIENRAEVAPLVRKTALWLMAIALAIVFLVSSESELIVRLLYGSKYADTVWVLQWLVWAIVLSFGHNLFAHLMIVGGAQRLLLVFSLVTLASNMLLNLLLVPRFGLAGASAVFVLTKLVMVGTSAAYCQLRFNLFRLRDFAFLLPLTCGCVLLYVLLDSIITHHVAVALCFSLYVALLWKPGTRLLGSLPGKERK